jgi:O-antigen/teichoic acid export membrane protein
MIKGELLKEIGRYSAGNYVARVMLDVAVLALPMVVINTLGAESNAYFVVAWAIVAAIRVIPTSVSNSLFAEGSNDEDSLMVNAVKSLKLIFLILIPVVLVIAAIGDKILLIFGESYSENGTILLRIMIFSVIPWSISYIYISIERVRKKVSGIIKVSSALACLSLGLGYLLMLKMGIVGMGIGYLVGQSAVAMSIVLVLFRKRRSRTSGGLGKSG